MYRKIIIWRWSHCQLCCILLCYSSLHGKSFSQLKHELNCVVIWSWTESLFDWVRCLCGLEFRWSCFRVCHIWGHYRFTWFYDQRWKLGSDSFSTVPHCKKRLVCLDKNKETVMDSLKNKRSNIEYLLLLLRLVSWKLNPSLGVGFLCMPFCVG